MCGVVPVKIAVCELVGRREPAEPGLQLITAGIGRAPRFNRPVLIQLSARPCRAQNLEPQCFRLTKGDGRLLLPEQDGGGMGASVVWMGDRGLFQI
jgi:hypothetical protein